MEQNTRKNYNSVDSVAERHSLYGKEKALELLLRCEVLWNNLYPVRKQYSRAHRFTYGDQWGDLITVNGKTMTQREYVAKVGNVALQTNQVKRIVNTISGLWTKEDVSPVLHARDNTEQALGFVMTELLKANWDRNEMKVMMSLALEELLIGGICIARETYERRFSRKEDAWTDLINIDDFFFEAGMNDPRFGDMSIIGQRHEVTFDQLCAKFVKSPRDYEKLKDIYVNQANIATNNDNIYPDDRADSARLSFYTPRDSKRCLLYEVWTEERRPKYHVLDPSTADTYDILYDDKGMIAKIEAENAFRARQRKEKGWSEEMLPPIEYKEHFFVDVYWYYRFITPQGDILMEGESPFPDRMHPYTMCIVPFTKGKISSYVNDAIDQNIAINRILTLDDWIRRSGAKGVTFVPQSIIPDGMDYRTFAEQWTSIDGIVFYKPNNNGDKPFTEYGNVGNLNTAELVKMMNDLIESGVNVSGAIQGQTPHAGTSAALFERQTQNSSIPIASFMAKFDMFVKRVTEKKGKYIQDNYDVERIMKVVSSMKNIDPASLNLNDVSEMDYDYKMQQNIDAPTLRSQENQLLINLASGGLIPIEDALECGEFYCKDMLLQRIQARKQEMAQQQMMGEPMPQIGADYNSKRQMLLGA